MEPPAAPTNSLAAFQQEFEYVCRTLRRLGVLPADIEDMAARAAIGVAYAGKRRHMAGGDNLLSQPLKRVMTPKPICIRDDALAVEALKIFNERNIDDLIVVNAKNEPVGLIDSQDLPKLKIV